MRRTTKALSSLILTFALFACAPPGPGQRYEECQSLRGPAVGCELRLEFQSLSPGNSLVWAVGGAWTTDPPTVISIQISIYRLGAGNVWEHVWTDRNLASPVQSSSLTTAPQACGRGIYRADMQVKINGRDTIYTKITENVLVP